MEYTYSKKIIRLLDKEQSPLDKLVLEFVKTIDFKYVIISGYIAILLGRSRNTEDVDMFIERISEQRFSNFCDRLYGLDFYILNAENSDDAYDILKEGSSVRFAKNGTIEPNFEIKFPKRDTDYYSLENPIRVIINGKYEFITSPLELQIVYKLYLGSEKDYLDARHIYRLFEKDIKKEELKIFLEKLNIKDKKAEEVLGGSLD